MRLYFVVAAAAAGGWAKPTDSDPRSANLHSVNSLFCTLYGPNSTDSRTGVSALAPFMSCISAWESPVLSDAVTIAHDDSRRIKLLDDITRISRASSILITISKRLGTKDQRPKRMHLFFSPKSQEHSRLSHNVVYDYTLAPHMRLHEPRDLAPPFISM